MMILSNGYQVGDAELGRLVAAAIRHTPRELIAVPSHAS